MKRIVLILVVVTCVAWQPVTARADFGVDQFDVAFSASNGSPVTQAGSHPFAFTTSFDLNLDGEEPDGRLKDLTLEWPAGVVANTTALPSCLQVDFEQLDEGFNDCSDMTAVGIATGFYDEAGKSATAPVFKLVPASGSLMSLGFRVADATNVILDIRLEQGQPHRLGATVRDELPESIELFGLSLQLWGVPADPAHDESRGHCVGGSGECPVSVEERPLLTLPTSCEGPLESNYEALSREDDIVAGSSLTHDGVGTPQGMTGCGILAFSPLVDVDPTTEEAKSPTGLDLSLKFFDEGLSNPAGIAGSTVRELVLALPDEMTAAPILTNGAGACTEADFAEESPENEPEEGCPDTAEIGTVEVETPLIEGTTIAGTVHRAVPFANAAGDAPIALYVVLEDSGLGILVPLAVGIEPDPETGQLVAFAEELPQLPFNDLRVRLDEGSGAPLISPSLCGDYKTVVEFVPSAGGWPYLASSAFEIVSGPSGGPCPVDEGEPDPGQGVGAAGAPAQGAAPAIAGKPAPRRRHRCPKGKRRVRRHGKTRCVKRRSRRAKEDRGSPQRNL